MDNETIITLVSILGGLGLVAIAGNAAWTRIKATLESVQVFLKNFLLAIKDNQLTKEEIDALFKDGKNIIEALKGKYEESSSEEPKEQSSETSTERYQNDK